MINCNDVDCFNTTSYEGLPRNYSYLMNLGKYEVWVGISGFHVGEQCFHEYLGHRFASKMIVRVKNKFSLDNNKKFVNECKTFHNISVEELCKPFDFDIWYQMYSYIIDTFGAITADVDFYYPKVWDKLSEHFTVYYSFETNQYICTKG